MTHSLTAASVLLLLLLLLLLFQQQISLDGRLRQLSLNIA